MVEPFFALIEAAEGPGLLKHLAVVVSTRKSSGPVTIASITRRRKHPGLANMRRRVRRRSRECFIANAAKLSLFTTGSRWRFVGRHRQLSIRDLRERQGGPGP